MANALSEFGDLVKGGSGETKGDNSIVAVRETSPATAAHAIGSYLYYNDITYKAKTAIAIGDTLTVGTNIEVPTLDEGTVIYVPDEDGTLQAVMVSYDNSLSGLSATSVQGAIDEIALGRSVSVVGDGIKTWGQMFNELYALIDRTKVTNNATLQFTRDAVGNI